jgi:putative membrane protein
MLTLMWAAAVVAALVHVLIFCMESLWWTTPRVRARFGQTPDTAEVTRLFAFNQGFYNLFLALGIFAGVALGARGPASPGFPLVVWSCLSMCGAALVLVFSARRLWRGALIQGGAPLLFLLLAAVTRHG